MQEEWYIEGCINGQEKARHHIYVTFGPVLKSICLRYMKENGEDTFHDCFIKILHSIEKYNYKGSFEGWLKRLTVNYCLDQLKKKNKLVILEPNALPELADESVDEEVNMDSETMRRLIFTPEDLLGMVQELPTMYGLVFFMFQMDGFTHNEIARELNIDEQTSRSRLTRAKKKLRVLLTEKAKQK